MHGSVHIKFMKDFNVATYNLLQQAITNWDKDMERGSVFLFIFLHHSQVRVSCPDILNTALKALHKI
jgi:hypothetical protein